MTFQPTTEELITTLFIFIISPMIFLLIVTRSHNQMVKNAKEEFSYVRLNQNDFDNVVK